MFLVCIGKQVVREVFSLHLRISTEKLKNFGASNDLITTLRVLLCLIVIDLKEVVNFSVRPLLLLLSKGSLFELVKDSIGILRLGREHIIVDKPVINLKRFLVVDHVERGLVVRLMLSALVEDECVHLCNIILVDVIALKRTRVNHIWIGGFGSSTSSSYMTRKKLDTLLI